MGREDLRRWTAQVVGVGFVEARVTYHDANGRLVESQIIVSLTDGTTSALVTRLHPDGEVTTEGLLRYPDDTHVSTAFHPDGRFDIVHMHPTTMDTITWNYQRDGAATVQQVSHHDVGTGSSVVRMVANLQPDGTPTGDLWEDEQIDDPTTGEHTSIQTTRKPDGTTKKTVKVWAADGELIRDETSTTHPPPRPEPGTPSSTEPTVPAPVPGNGRSPVDIITTTTRSPDPQLPSPGGWVGPGGLPSGHIKDWWYEDRDGRVTFLGTTAVTTKKE